MTLTLYKTLSANNKVDKELTDEFELGGYLRDGEFNILRPIIRVQQNVTEYNYAYVPEFGRYYFIDSVRVDRTNVFYVSLRVDVLMTYAEAIKNMFGVLSEGGERSPYLSSQLDTEVRHTLSRVDFADKFSDGEFILIATKAGVN